MQMINVRLKFAKGSEVKYISHLDLMRTFMRVVRRAEIPIAYSGGFNPHPEMSFGAPLSVGVASLAEYVDIELAKEVPLQDIVDGLNKFMPVGIKVLGAIRLPERFKSAMALITHAKYSIRVNIENPDKGHLKTKLLSFINQKSILAQKRQPKKNFQIKEFDIRPMILEMDLVDCEESGCIFTCLLQSGSKANLKPEILIEAFGKYADVNIVRTTITREEVFVEQDGKLIDLLQYKD
jgi:radical SAM-linked protein